MTPRKADALMLRYAMGYYRSCLAMGFTKLGARVQLEALVGPGGEEIVRLAVRR